MVRRWGRRIGVVVALWAPLVGAVAGDDPKEPCVGEGCKPPWEGDYFCGDKCDPIEAKTLEEYEALLIGLEDGAVFDPWPGEYEPPGQLWEGATGIISWEPDFRGFLTEVAWGQVFTKFEADRWVESWVVRTPELAMRTEPTLKHEGLGRLSEALPRYRLLTDAADYRLLTFEFRYMCPPGIEMIATLPTTVPRFVDQVDTYRVFFTVGTQPESEVGALYREHISIPGAFGAPTQIFWQDTWVLWDNFGLPDPGAVVSGRRDVRLEATPWQGQTVRTFLQRQLLIENGLCMVRTMSPEAPL